MRCPQLYPLLLLFLVSAALAQRPALLPVLINDKYGYCDANGVVVIAPQFDQAGHFSNELLTSAYPKPTLDFWYAPVSKGAFVDWIDIQGRSILPIDSITRIECTPLNQQLFSLAVYRPAWGTQWPQVALVDPDFRVLRPFEWVQYESVNYYFNFNYGSNFAFRKSVESRYNRQGIINARGETLVEPNFETVSNLYKNRFFASLPGKGWKIYERPDKVIDTLPYTPASGIRHGLIAVSRFRDDVATPGMYYGLVDINGKLAAPLVYQSLKPYDHGIAFGKRPDGGWDVLDSLGKLRLAIREPLGFAASQDHFFVSQDSGRWQGYDYKFRPFLSSNLAGPPVFFQEKGQVVYGVKIGEDSVFVDVKGRELGRHHYEYTIPISQKPLENLYRVSYQGKWGLAKKTARFQFREIITPQFKDAQFPIQDDLIVVKNGQKYGVMDVNGKQILPCEWDAISFKTAYEKVRPGWIYVERNKRKGAFHKDGSEAMPCVFQYFDQPIILNGHRIWLDTMAGVTYLYNDQGYSKTLDTSYHFLMEEMQTWRVQYRYMLVEKDHKFGLMDFNFQWVFKPAYYDCGFSSDGKYLSSGDSSGWTLWDAVSRKKLASAHGSIDFNQNEPSTIFATIDTVQYGIWLASAGKFIYRYHPMEPFSDGLTRIYDKGKIGFMNQEAQIVIPPQFSKVEPFAYQTAVVTQDSLAGVIDTLGRTLIPFQYFDIKRLKGNCFRVQKVKEGQYDLLNEQCQTIVTNVFSIDTLADDKFFIWSRGGTIASDFSGGLIVDASGKVYVEDVEQVFYSKSGVAYMKDGQYREAGIGEGEPLKLITTLGKTNQMPDGLLWVGIVCYETYNDAFRIQGLIKQDGTPVIPVARHYIEHIPATGNYLVANDQNFMALFDRSGHQLSEFKYRNSIQYDYTSGFYFESQKDPSDANTLVESWLNSSWEPIGIKRKWHH